MNILFKKKGNKIHLVDYEKLIFKIDGKFIKNK